MKKLIFILVILSSLNLYSQGSSVSLEFRANMRANQILGVTFSVQNDFAAMPTPLDIKFDGKNLIIYTSTGAAWAEWKVLNWRRKEALDNGSFLKKENYILEVKEEECTLYYVIEILTDKHGIDPPIYTLKRPRMGEDGVLSGYMLFQQY